MDSKNFVIDEKGLKLMIVGLIVLVAGLILMAGGGVKAGESFNYSMFNFQRLVVAPVVILCAIIVEVVAIMRSGKKRK